MNKEIALFNQPIQDPKIIIDGENLNAILTEIYDLKNQVFDLSNMEGVESLKELKSIATKWIKDFKSKCEPYEAEGKKVMDARSRISTTLLTGKQSVINEMLEPIITIEKRLKDLNMSIVTPITDLHSCDMRAEELEQLKSYEWLAYEKQAKTLIEQQEAMIAFARNKIESEIAEEKKKADIERLNREAEIAKNAAEQATRVAEDRLKKEVEDKERAEQAKVNVQLRQKEAERLKAEGVEHKRKICNEILEALKSQKHRRSSCKELVMAIARNEIPHLYIEY